MRRVFVVLVRFESHRNYSKLLSVTVTTTRQDRTRHIATVWEHWYVPSAPSPDPLRPSTADYNTRANLIISTSKYWYYNGLSQVCCRLGDLERKLTSLLARGSCWFKWVVMDTTQCDQAGALTPSISSCHKLQTNHARKQQDDGSNCSVFTFDVNANKSRLPLAKNAMRKFRTLRHPGVLRVLDTIEVRTNLI